MPPITTIASNSPENATEIGSAEVMRLLKSEQHAGEPRQRCREREGDQLVAIGGVAEETRPLLVLADRDQHRADRRTMEAPQPVDHRHADDGDEDVEVRRLLEIDAEEQRAL